MGGRFRDLGWVMGGTMLWIQKGRLDMRTGYSGVLVVLLLAIGMLANGCVAPRATPEQVISPILPSNNATVINNRWRIAEVTYQGNPVVFDAVGSIYVFFRAVGVSEGVLEYYAYCPPGPDGGTPGGGYKMFAEDANQYRLVQGDSPAYLCGEPIDSQLNQIKNTLAATTRYEIDGQRLYLLGEESKIALEIDNPQ